MESSTYTFRIRILNEDEVEAEIRDPADALQGEPVGTLRYALNKTRLHELAQKAFDDQYAPAEIQELGVLLFETLFDQTVSHEFFTWYEKVVFQEKGLLRLELDVNPKQATLAALPWEFLCTPDNQYTGGYVFLATAPNLILSRRRKRLTAPELVQLGPDEKVRVAVVVSRPSNLGVVSYEPLYQELAATLAGLPVELELVDPITNPATQDYLDEVLERRPHIFHFIGHGRVRQPANGDPIHEIAVMRDNLQARWLAADKFGGLLDRHRPKIVILQACQSAAGGVYTGVAARVVERNIPVVIAMQYEISNAAARKFAREFYRRIAQGDSVDKAVQEGRNQISDWNESRDLATPVLFMRDRHGRLFNRQQPLVSIQTPTAVTQSSQLRQALSQLNYQPQKAYFSEILWKPQRLGAFFISGPVDAGQRWLLKLLVEEITNDQSPHDPKLLDVGNRIYGKLGIGRLWGDLAARFGLAFDAAPEAVRAKIIEEWQKQDILLVLDNVAKNDPDFPQAIIEELWLPLVKNILSDPKLAASKHWLLLFLVDNDGFLGQNNLEVMTLTAAGWQPTNPIQLPPLADQFAEQELRSWLSAKETRNAMTAAQLPLEDMYKVIMQRSVGIPMEVIKTVCDLCKQDWREVEKVWLKL